MRRKGSAAERLVALRALDTPAWRAEVSTALGAAKGNVAHAAVALGIGHRALFRWLAEDRKLREAVAVVRAKEIVARDERRRCAQEEAKAP